MSNYSFKEIQKCVKSQILNSLIRNIPSFEGEDGKTGKCVVGENLVFWILEYVQYFPWTH